MSGWVGGRVSLVPGSEALFPSSGQRCQPCRGKRYGTTAVCALRIGNTVYVAHAGDSRAVRAPACACACRSGGVNALLCRPVCCFGRHQSCAVGAAAHTAAAQPVPCTLCPATWACLPFPSRSCPSGPRPTPCPPCRCCAAAGGPSPSPETTSPPACPRSGSASRPRVGGWGGAGLDWQAARACSLVPQAGS